MKCDKHPEREAVDVCSICDVAVCDECCIKVAGRTYCRRCKDELVQRIQGEPNVLD